MDNGVAAVSCPWPWLLFVSGEKLENQVLYDVVSDPKTTGLMRSIPELTTNKSILMPTNISGWFFLEPSSELCLWNAVTLQSIALPPLKMPEYRIDYILLTRSPDERDCMILLFLGNLPGILYHYVNEQDGGWTFRDYQEELMEFRGGREFEFSGGGDRFKRPIVCGDDKIFMISYSGLVAAIEAVKPKCLVIRHCQNFPRSHHSHIVGPSFWGLVDWVTCCGNLFEIIVRYRGPEWNQIVSIDVFKLDFEDMSLKKVDSYPNAAFFIKGQQRLACPITSVNSSKVGNQVYIVDEKKLLLHIYHIQQKTLQTFSIALPNNESKLFWMMVSHAQALPNAEDDFPKRLGCENTHLFVKINNSGVIVAHKDYEDEERNYSIALNDLPIDILKTILSKLINPSDYLNFRATSRSFRDKFSAKEWLDIKTPESDSNPSPWLIYRISQKGLYSMVDPVSRNKYYVRVPENDSEICYSAEGWLLLSSPCLENGIVNYFNLAMYNPATKCIIRFPKINPDAKHFFVGCSIVGISVDGRPYFRAIYKIYGEGETDIDENDREWEVDEQSMMQEYDNDKYVVEQTNANAVFVGEAYYFHVGDGNIAYFSEDDYTLRIHYLKDPCSGSSYEQCFLAECDEDLLSIYIGIEWKWLRAFKFNKSDLLWNEVKELNNNNLYLSYVSSTTSKPQSHEVGNKIYFSRFYQDSIIYYSFNTQKFHINDEHNSIMCNYEGSKEQFYSCWIEPSWANGK